ncbi:MAG TPA: hypothetical protein VIU61_21185 [Kofleriaceae bacterium]
MSVVRTLALTGLAAQLAGCFVFSMPPSVPKVNRPNLGPDTFLEANSEVVRESSTRGETSRVCSGGDCTSFTTYVPTTIRVHVATPTANGSPISIGALAAASSPEYVTDTERAGSLTSKCKRGRILMTGGGLALTTAFVLLSVGYNKDKPNQNAAIGGFAAAGAAVVGLAGGRYFFGGQYCDDAEKLYRKWAVVYKDADATKVKRDAAEMVDVLVDKFNKDRSRVAKPDAEPAAPDADPTDEPAED